MRGASIVSAVHHLKIAKDFLDDFIREHPSSKGGNLFKDYQTRINWMFKNLVSHPFLPEPVRSGIRREIESDVFAVTAINEKVALLPPDQRNMIETIIDGLLNGEEIQITD